jgi:hypothetical protein
MTTIHYGPQFQHTDWLDNVSRVKAGGEDGFNRRFHGLEEEFATISSVVDAINTRLQQLSTQPAPTEVKTSVTPVTTALGNQGWSHIMGGATKPGGATAASGMIPIAVPHGNRIRSLRALGTKSGAAGTLDVNLRRQQLNPGAATQIVVTVTAQQGDFDQTSAAPATEVAKVDTSQFRYYVTLELDSVAAGDVVRVMGIQITHIAE